jgi:hypothetical protein
MAKKTLLQLLRQQGFINNKTDFYSLMNRNVSTVVPGAYRMK